MTQPEAATLLGGATEDIPVYECACEGCREYQPPTVHMVAMVATEKKDGE